ncbi:MAG: hypothetical protein VKJ04_04630 [Vampirovibrionales bacterium]|nr:hypothetical protein [Vampirovibrionales bacterium]
MTFYTSLLSKCQRHWGLSLLLLILLALLLRFFCSGMRVFVSADSLAYLNSAQALLTGTYHETYIERTPGYIILLTLLQGLGSLFYGELSQSVFQKLLLLFQSLLGLCNIVLFAVIARRLLGNPLWALLAALLLALSPELLLYEHAMLSETLYTNCLLVLFWGLSVAFDQKPLSALLLLFLSVLSGLLMWVKPVAVSALACVGCWLWLSSKSRQPTKRLQPLLFYGFGILLCVFPWMLFNATQHNAFVFSAGQGANQLYKMIDFVDWSTPVHNATDFDMAYKDRLRFRVAQHPAGETYNAVNDMHVVMDQEAKRQPDYSTIYLAHNEAAGKIAWQAILNNPLAWLWVSACQWVDFFFKPPAPIVAKVPLFSLWAVASFQAYQVLASLALLGVGLSYFRRDWPVLFSGAIIFSHSLLYALTTLSDARYRLPLTPFFILLAVYAVKAFYACSVSSSSSNIDKAEAVFGG